MIYYININKYTNNIMNILKKIVNNKLFNPKTMPNLDNNLNLVKITIKIL